MRPARRSDERGLVLPTGALVASIVAVAVAAVGLVLTSGPDPQTPPAAATTQATTTTPSATPTKAAKVRHHKPQVHRAGTYVEVFNNSGVKGLAGRTSARAQGAGWNVVGSDNWYGTVEASTVYYPHRLAAEARLLARDLGLNRLRPAILPMKLDRLTVILTADYH